MALPLLLWALRQDPKSPNLLNFLALQQLRMGAIAEADKTIALMETLQEKGWPEVKRLKQIRASVLKAMNAQSPKRRR